MKFVLSISMLMVFNYFQIQTMELNEELPPIWGDVDYLNVNILDDNLSLNSSDQSLTSDHSANTQISNVPARNKRTRKRSREIPSKSKSATRKNTWLHTTMNCPGCNKEFTKKEIISHFQLSEQALCCQFCEFICCGHLFLKQHIKKEHEQDIYYKNKLSMRKLAASLSIKFGTMSNTDTIQCITCIPSKEILNQDLHIRTHHLRHKCPLDKCAFYCEGFLALQTHLETTHSLYDICGKSDFKYIALLNQLGKKQ